MCIICGDTAHLDFDNLYTLSHKQRVELDRSLNIGDVIANAINKLYDDRKIDNETRQHLNKIHYEPLKQGVNEGFNQVIKVEYGTPNYEFLKQLQINTAVFACFKNHAAIKEMAARLKDENGNLRSREDFKREALKIDASYRGSKLNVEYDTAVRTARMAANWQKYEAKQKLYPNLKYLRSKAGKPDENHLAYVGIIRSVNDPFWNTHFPPNRWRCQCSVEQTDEAPTDIPNNLPPVDESFAFNAGKTGQVYDLKNSDYIKSVPPKEQPSLIRDAEKIVQKDIALNAKYQTLYSSKKGHSVKAHPLAFDNNDFDDNLNMARKLANEGRPVNILPDVSDKELRQALLPKQGVKGQRNPDYYIDNMVFELKKVLGKSKHTIKHQLDEARQQCDNAIIEIQDDFPFTKYQVIKQIKTKMRQKEMQGFGQVWVYYKGQWLYNPHK